MASKYGRRRLRTGNVGSRRQGTTKFYNFPIRRVYGMTPDAGGRSAPRSNYQAQNEREKQLGYKAIKRGEERMGKDATLSLVDKYIKDMIPGGGQLPALNEAQKQLEIKASEDIQDRMYGKRMGDLASLSAGTGIGATGLQAKSTLASGKEQYGKARNEALERARSGILAGTLRSAQQAQGAAANLGLGAATARAGAAQPFTMAESKARFGTSFPNV